jgi:hypothetical protein
MSRDFKKEIFMSVVFAWSPDDENWGHASLFLGTFNPGITDMRYYVSWWPGKGRVTNGANALSALPGWKHKKSLNTLNQDIACEGRKPDLFVNLNELDVNAMKDAWEAIASKPHAHWRLLHKNCATIVARVLRAGGADRYTNFAESISVWTPSRAIKFAEAIKVGLEGK